VSCLQKREKNVEARERRGEGRVVKGGPSAEEKACAFLLSWGERGEGYAHGKGGGTRLSFHPEEKRRYRCGRKKLVYYLQRRGGSTEVGRKRGPVPFRSGNVQKKEPAKSKKKKKGCPEGPKRDEKKKVFSLGGGKKKEGAHKKGLIGKKSS